MFDTHVPVQYWPEAIATATYLTNCLPQQILNFQTPLATLNTFTPVPSSHSLPPRIFGCVVYVHLSSRVRTKFEPRAVKCVFLGYGPTQKGYRCYDPVHHKLYTTMDCDFFEHSPYYTQPQAQEEIMSEDLSWLTHPLADSQAPKEQVGTTTDIATDIVTESSAQTTTPVPEHPAEQEVTPSPTAPSIDISTDHIVPSSVVVRRKYNLPPRSTRGMPPKRYDPEYESQRSRHPIGRPGDKQLSQTAVAFNASLHSSTIPKKPSKNQSGSKLWTKRS